MSGLAIAIYLLVERPTIGIGRRAMGAAPANGDGGLVGSGGPVIGQVTDPVAATGGRSLS